MLVDKTTSLPYTSPEKVCQCVDVRTLLVLTCGASPPLCKSSPEKAAPGWLWISGWLVGSTGVPPSALKHPSSQPGSSAPGDNHARHGSRPRMLGNKCFPKFCVSFECSRYLRQPGSAVPLPVGLQVATSIGCLVNQTQQLHTLWQAAKERICDTEEQQPITKRCDGLLDLIWKMNLKQLSYWDTTGGSSVKGQKNRINSTF